MPRSFLVVAAVALLVGPLSAQSPYRKPPADVSAILDAKPTPSVSISPTRDTLALLEFNRYPSIAEVSEPKLRLAGLRINPKTNGRAGTNGIGGLTFVNLATRHKTEVKLPDGKVSGPIWSHDGKRFAVSIIKADGIALGLGTVADGKLTEVPEVRLNAAIGEAIQWLSPEEVLLKTIPAKRGKPPEAPAAPSGPVIQESSGTAAPVRTFQDMLQNAHDEAPFEYFGTSQLAVLNVDGKLAPLGEPALVTGVDPSPDSKHLLVTKLRKPFSYLYPYSAFPQTVDVWDRDAKAVYTVATRPLQDKIPIEGVPTGPRNPRWIPTAAATLVWAEALDDGDPKKRVPHRDELFTLAAPFAGKPKSASKTEHRLSSLDFFATGNWLVADYDRERKWSRSQIVDVSNPEAKPITLKDRSAQDRYGDIGTPLTQMLPNGERVIRVLDSKLVLSSVGATPKGEFPTLKTYDPVSKESKTLFQCREGFYETASLLDDDGKKLLVRRESPTEPANYFLKDGDAETALTANADPFPELRKVKRELITAKRADGVTISFTLYTPPGTKDGEKLPTVFWAYPTEFSSADTASQVSGSQNRFVTPAGYSHLFFLTRGYAVMDDVSMPVVGKPESANDSFLEQLAMNAKAAIDKACEVGPVDRDRIGVGGHSYGAFMTANLLAHTDLFKAGIARSGAYNRTLTPFGFQNERRTFWEAPEVYAKMSPFNAAHKIRSPILMIHGQADGNAGTFPVQSERMYQAVRGNGGKAKLVLLPHEDHGYSAKESVEHVLAEQIEWFDTHVKGAKVTGRGEK